MNGIFEIVENVIEDFGRHINNGKEMEDIHIEEIVDSLGNEEYDINLDSLAHDFLDEEEIEDIADLAEEATYHYIKGTHTQHWINRH